MKYFLDLDKLDYIEAKMYKGTLLEILEKTNKVLEEKLLRKEKKIMTKNLKDRVEKLLEMVNMFLVPTVRIRKVKRVYHVRKLV